MIPAPLIEDQRQSSKGFAGIPLSNISRASTWVSRGCCAMRQTPAYEEYGMPDRLQQMQGITPEIGERIGAIVTFGAAIEYHMERHLWHALKPYKGVCAR